MGPFTGDLVCWDFGDTLVDQTFMRRAPSDIPDWTDAYVRVRAAGDQGDRWDLANSTMRELAVLIAQELGIRPARAWRQLAINLTKIDWFPEARLVLTALNGQVPQAIVTVNPHEFWAMAVALDLHTLVDCVVTSADIDSLSKVDMCAEVRSMLGMSTGLSSTLLIDNMGHNIDDFVAAGGQGLLYEPATFADQAATLFPAQLSR